MPSLLASIPPSKFTFWINPEDRPFLPYLKGIFAGRTVHIRQETVVTLDQIVSDAMIKGASVVLTDNRLLLQKLLNQHGENLPSLEDYAGSLFEHKDIQFLVLPPVEHIATTRTGKFLYERFFSKITQPAKWFQQLPFSWEIVSTEVSSDAHMQAHLDSFFSANLIAVDIETTKTGEPKILSVAYTGLWLVDGDWMCHTITMPIENYRSVLWMRKFNLLPAPKIFQNGKFDNCYFLRYRSPVFNWLYDTQHLFHCWYSELPKDLAFLAAFMLRHSRFWKWKFNARSREEFLEYNAEDAWNTMNIFLALLLEMPAWAFQNYTQHEFPLVFPCIACEMDGWKIDVDARETLRKKEEAILEIEKRKLRIMVANPHYNPNSPAQTLRVMHMYGSTDLKSSKEVFLKNKFSSRHPLNKRIAKAIIDYREHANIISKELSDTLTTSNRRLYNLNPHMTDTARLASNEHHFRLGGNIQNKRRDDGTAVTKQIYVADRGYYLGEPDARQSEARCVGYQSGDANLIATVESDRDYHALNVERFFGLRYDAIINEYGKVINKEIRDLSKRTNHGANYNMGAGVMLDTMGDENVMRARSLLGLPPTMPLKDVCAFLLRCYEKAYPGVKGLYYESIKECIAATHMLVSPLGWTRYCFGNPKTSKRELNSYVAHPSQNLSVGLINRAMFDIFIEVQIPNWVNFRLKAQIHDSIPFQYRIGRLDLAWKAIDIMERNLQCDVVGADKVKRRMVIPVDFKAEAERWSDLKETTREQRIQAA